MSTIVDVTAPAGRDWRARFAAVVEWLARVGDSRKALWTTAVIAACLPWLSWRLPMVDLPQHAAQVALWRDLLLSASPWSELVQINLFTPYLGGYSLALPFTLIMPPAAALAVVLSGACLAFIAASIGLRKDLGADERLDWLMVTPFFGFSWQWGLFTFLIVAPLVVLFVRIALRHAKGASVRTSALLLGFGVVLLFSHGLAFAFACAVGGAWLLVEARSLRGLVVASVPYVLLGAACAAFALASRGFNSPAGIGDFLFDANPALRIAALFAHGHGFAMEIVPLGMLCLLVPLRLGLAISPRAAVPFAGVCLVMALVPHAAAATFLLYQRFGHFALPFYAVMFAVPATPQDRTSARAKGALALMVVACWSAIAVMGTRIAGFSREAADFEVVLAAAEPGKRALSIVADRTSFAAGHAETYLHFPLWYQADKHGLVDYSFASNHPPVVRYRAEHVAPTQLDSEWDSPEIDWNRMDWKKLRGRIYDYYFVRHGAGSVPQRLIDNGECAIEKVVTSGAWTLLKRGACKG